MLTVNGPGNVNANDAISGTGGLFKSGTGTLTLSGTKSNTYGGTRFPLLSVALIEVVMTALFLVVITGATSAKASPGFAPIAIGLTLTMIHLVAIPVSNASVNPARSTATALFAGGDAMQSLWLFWVAPIVGGIIGGLIGKLFYER